MGDHHHKDPARVHLPGGRAVFDRFADLGPAPASPAPGGSAPTSWSDPPTMRDGKDLPPPEEPRSPIPSKNEDYLPEPDRNREWY